MRIFGLSAPEVFVIDIDEHNAQKVMAEIKENNGEAQYILLDVANLESFLDMQNTCN